MVLEVEKPFGNRSEVLKVIGSENLPLDNRKIDFNLIKPARMNRAVDQDQSWIFLLEALGGGESAMGGAVVHDPEDAPSVMIGRSSHNLIDEAIKGSDSS